MSFTLKLQMAGRHLVALQDETGARLRSCALFCSEFYQNKLLKDSTAL